jgi:hypothetical protein
MIVKYIKKIIKYFIDILILINVFNKTMMKIKLNQIHLYHKRIKIMNLQINRMLIHIEVLHPYSINK